MNNKLKINQHDSRVSKFHHLERINWAHSSNHLADHRFGWLTFLMLDDTGQRAGGWLALACDFFFILKLHLWSCIVAVDVVRDTNRSRWAGVMDLVIAFGKHESVQTATKYSWTPKQVAHFRLKSAEVSTLHQLCLFDVGMLVLEQVAPTYVSPDVGYSS